MPSIPIFLINLDKSKDRLKRCEQQLAAQALDYKRVSAVYGADLDAALVEKYYPAELRYRYHVELSVGEIACYLSHQKIWQQMVTNKIPAAVILEDDIEFRCENFAQILDDVASTDIRWEYIKLSSTTQSFKTIGSERIGAYDLLLSAKPPTRTGAQIVSLKAAKKLLHHSKTFFRPIDVDLRYWWETEVPIHVMWPHPIKTTGNPETSEIQKLGRKKSGILRKPIKWKVLTMYFLHRMLKQARLKNY